MSLLDSAISALDPDHEPQVAFTPHAVEEESKEIPEETDFQLAKSVQEQLVAEYKLADTLAKLHPPHC